MNNLPTKLQKNKYTLATDYGFAVSQNDKVGLIRNDNSSLKALVDFAIPRKLKNVWIEPTSKLAAKIASNDLDMDDTFTVKINADENGELNTSSFYLYKKEGTYDERTSINITVPSHEKSTWPMPAENFSFKDMFLAIHTLAEKLPVNLQNTQGYVGRSFIDLTCHTPARASWLTPCDFKPDMSMQVDDLVWKCEASFEDKLYLHKYDKGSAYSAACTGTLFGEGSPVIYEKPRYAPNKAGIWQLSHIEAPTMYSSGVLPAAYDATRSWFYTPTVQAMITLGYTFQIERAYIWNTSHTTLTDYATSLWNIKLALDDEADSLARALALVWRKAIVTATVGGFRNDKVNDKRFHRIDFNDIIKAANRLRVSLTVDKYAKLNHKPVLAYNDAIYYLSDNPNPHEAVSDITKRQREHGGYKYEGSVRWSEIKPAFFDIPNVAGILHQFNLHKIDLTSTEVQ